jgi:hypothetical protein
LPEKGEEGVAKLGQTAGWAGEGEKQKKKKKEIVADWAKLIFGPKGFWDC